MTGSSRRTKTAQWILASAAALCTGAAFGHGTVGTPPAGGERIIEFPDTATHATLVVDLHTHSVFSDGHVWPSIRIGEALRDGLDAIAVTEHLEWQPHRADIPHPDRNRSYSEARDAADGSQLIVIAGSEITRAAPAGHMNAIFISDANALFKVQDAPADASDAVAYYQVANRWPAKEAVRAANSQGAFVFWNHPYYTRIYKNAIARMTDFHRSLISAGHLHGIEVANGNTYSEEALQLALDHDLTILGVSDVHNLIDWDYQLATGGHRPVTLVFTKERSAQAIKDALFAQRTVVWFKNLLIGRSDQLTPLLNASLEVADVRYRAELEIVRLTLKNRSSAPLLLRNTTDYTFLEQPDLFEVPAHGATALTLRPKRVVAELTLEFEVMNALTAPKVHPSWQRTVRIADVPVTQN